MHCHWGQAAAKKWNVAILNSAAHIKQKSSVTCVVGQNDNRAVYIASSESCQPNRDLFGAGTKLKESIFKITTKSIPLLQPEHGFCQQNGSERGQVQYWYLNEKMVVVPVCLNCRCCSSGCVGIVLTKIKAMSLCLF